MAALALTEVASALPWRSSRNHLRHWVSRSNAMQRGVPVFRGQELEMQRKIRNVRRNAGDDDFYDDVDDALDDQIESTLDMLDEGADKTAEEMMLGFGLPSIAATTSVMDKSGDRFLKPESEVAAGTIVSYKIDEEEFHKISLHECDFFIRKVPDPDNNVYDFREMYVTPPDTDVYSIPKVIGKMPKQKTRCKKSNWNQIVLVLSNDKNKPREPMGRNEFHALKVILIKHYKNRRALAENFVLNFERVFVIDGATKSIRRAKVKLEVPGGKNRDRSQEILVVRDGGTSFAIIPQDQRKSPDEVIEEAEWNQSREEVENYLRTFRDFDVSNWF